MSKKKEHPYEPDAFGRRIRELQEKYKYTNKYVINGVVDENNYPLINDLQTYGAYKSGKRKCPRNFDIMLPAFAKFYDVTTDYILGLEDTPNHNVKAVEDSTGLSEKAVRGLMKFNNSYPDVMMMLNSILSSLDSEDKVFFINLYNQIYRDYKDKQLNDTSSSYDLEKMQQRFFLTQQTYEYIKEKVTTDISTEFDKQIIIDQEYYNHNYEHSFEDIFENTIETGYTNSTITIATPVEIVDIHNENDNNL